MGDLSQRFNRSEFACQCGCGFDTVDVELIDELESLADYMQREYLAATRVVVHINSGCRCPNHNFKVGASETSQHVYGRAVDFWMEIEYADGQREKVPDDRIADHLEIIHAGRYGIGRYNGRTHLDTRSNGPARWDKR